MGLKKKDETVKESKPTTKSYTALVTKNIGSNPDGTAKLKLIKGQPVEIPSGKAKAYLSQNLIK